MKQAIFVLIAGVISALLATIFFISYFGPSGRYALTSVLLKPDILEKLNYNDWNSKTSEQDRFIFDRIVFENSKALVQNVDIPTYRRLYALIQNDQSETADELEEQNNYFHSAGRLILYVKTESPSLWQFLSKPIQQMQFDSRGNHYRVQLREDNQGIHWATFHHEGIDKEIEAILNNG